MENLKALVYKGDPTPYQRALAQREFEGMIERLEIYENAVKEQGAVIKTCKCEMPAKIHGKNLCWRCKQPLS